MNGTQESSVAEQPPAFWYDLPQGYVQLDVYPTPERLATTAREILALPEEVRERADGVFRLYAITMWELQKQRVQGCAMGMHPDDRGGVTTSFLTVFSVDTQGANPKAAMARLVDGDDAGADEHGFVPVELPCGLGFRTDTVRSAPAPGRPAAGGDLPDEQPVWQGMVAIPDVRSSMIIVVQLVSSSVELAEEYRGVLHGVAGTVSFADPKQSDGRGQPAEPMPGSAAEAVRNDFG